MVYCHLDLIDTSGAARETLRTLPRRFQYPEGADLLQRKAAPVSVPALTLQAALPFAAILIAQDAQPASFIPTKHVWTQQPLATFLDSYDRAPASHRRPDQTVHVIR